MMPVQVKSPKDKVAEPHELIKEGLGQSLSDAGFMAKIRRKGLEVAGKGVLIAAMGLMSFGSVGCSKNPEHVPQPTGQQEVLKKQIDFRVQQAKMRAAEWGRQADPARADMGGYTRDDMGNIVSKPERWKQLLMKSAGKKVMDGDEVERIAEELDALEKHMGPEKVRQLTAELDRELKAQD